MIRFCSALTSAATFKIVNSKVTENNNKNEIKEYDQVKKSVACHVDGVYLHRSPVAKASTSCKRFYVLRNKPRKCLHIRKKTLLSFVIKAVLLLAKKRLRRGSDERTQEGQYD